MYYRFLVIIYLDLINIHMCSSGSSRKKHYGLCVEFVCITCYESQVRACFLVLDPALIYFRDFLQRSIVRSRTLTTYMYTPDVDLMKYDAYIVLNI